MHIGTRLGAAGLAAALLLPTGALAAGPAQAQARQEDLDTLYAALQEHHPDLYANTPQEAFEAKKAEIEGRLAEESDVDFALDLQSLVALIGDSHTTTNIGSVLNSTGLYPFGAEWYDGSWVLTGAEEEDAALLGQTVTALNGVPMDEIFNQMAKVRYMFGGQAKVPLVLRAPDGSAGGGAAQHSQCVESWFAHIPGIKVVAPSNPYDAKMVLKAAIECDDPVLYFENKILYKEKGEVPEIGEEEPYTLGKARVEREGKDVTIVSYSIGMKNARGAADLLAKEGIEAEVIDLITLSPWDKETVLNSVKKTHRLCIVHEAVKQGGFGAEISATVAEEAMEYLDAPILRYGAPFCPIPFAPTLEKMVKVVPEDLVKGIKGMF